ncbi:DNA-binding protein [Caballeronia choica]|uniref:DNA-binding protein n=1 Tax=Caballeronia choica TaxID=326476 RepID=A0A158L2R9_9BURK|nr:GntR family transcriptional regulator [Caballeronia choica]SAL87319.1 DNA-binding protein [Caballeronia choica]
MAAARSGSQDLPTLELVPRETMAERVYLQLREAIMTGRFAPGQTLTLRGVAEAVGSSTMPVRGALTRLQAEGALIDGPGRGLMVPPMTLEILDELRDGRIALEGCIAKRAATRMTKADLSALQRVFDRMDARAKAGDVAGYLRGNFEFHQAIYAHGCSEVMMGTVQNLWMRIGPFLNLVAPDLAHIAHSMEAHRQIFDALKRGDGEAARAGIERDLGDAADDIKARLLSREAANAAQSETA